MAAKRYVWVVEDFDYSDPAESGLMGIYSAMWKANEAALALIIKFAGKDGYETFPNDGKGLTFRAKTENADEGYGVRFWRWAVR